MENTDNDQKSAALVFDAIKKYQKETKLNVENNKNTDMRALSSVILIHVIRSLL